VGVPAGQINSVQEVFADPQVQARLLVGTVHSRDGEAIPTVRLPVRMSGLAAPGTSPGTSAAPRLGQHNDETWLK
jgi:crotonobetainyl-CoA:carnitine CoA-transferase CaiB-like acyl-CoA transferase